MIENSSRTQTQRRVETSSTSWHTTSHPSADGSSLAPFISPHTRNASRSIALLAFLLPKGKILGFEIQSLRSMFRNPKPNILLTMVLETRTRRS